MHTALSPLFAAVIFGCAHWDVARRTTFIDRALRPLGDASYALYLFQFPVRAITVRAVPLWTYLLVLHVVALIVSGVFERPARRLLASAFNR